MEIFKHIMQIHVFHIRFDIVNTDSVLPLFSFYYMLKISRNRSNNFYLNYVLIQQLFTENLLCARPCEVVKDKHVFQTHAICLFVHFKGGKLLESELDYGKMTG